MTNNDDSLHESFGEVEDSGSDEASLADSLSIDSFDFQGLVDGEYKNMDTSADLKSQNDSAVVSEGSEIIDGLHFPRTLKGNDSWIRKTEDSTSEKLEHAMSPDSTPAGSEGGTGTRGRRSSAISDKIEMFQQLDEKAKQAAMTKPPLSRPRSKSPDPSTGIGNDKTPTAREIRKKIELGEFSTPSGRKSMPVLVRLSQTGAVKAQVERFGAFSKERESTLLSPKSPEKAVDIAAKFYIQHMSATKIQALARGYLYRQKDRDATSKVLRWLQQNQEVKKVLSADPTAVSDEERLSAVMALADAMAELEPEVPDAMDASASTGLFTEETVSDIFTDEETVMSNDDEVVLISKEFVGLLGHFDMEEDETKKGFSSVAQTHMIEKRRKEIINAVLKIQALGRGYIIRKFDIKAMMETSKWVTQMQQELEEQEAPEEEELNAAWVVLEKNNASTTKDMDDLPANTHGATQKFDVNELVSTWEWIKEKASNAKIRAEFQDRIETKAPPGVDELAKLYDWLVANGYPYQPKVSKTRADGSISSDDVLADRQNFDELLSLWNFLESNGLNMNSFRKNEGERKEGDDSIRYIDEEVSSVYKEPKPSVRAMFDFWNFTRTHSKDSIAEAAPDSDATEDAEDSQIKPPTTKEETLSTDQSDDESSTQSDTFDDESILGKGLIGGGFMSKRAARNIDSMMSSFRFMKKQGLDLNKLRTRELPKPKKEEKEAEGDQSDLPIPLTTSDMASTLDWLKTKSPGSGYYEDDMEKMLSWLEEKGFDPNSRIPKDSKGQVNIAQSLEPPSVEDMTDALRWLYNKGDEPTQTKASEESSYKDILYNLSWLKKHGYDLDKTAQAVEEIDRNQAVSNDDLAMKESAASSGDNSLANESEVPSLFSMMIALGAAGKKTVSKTSANLSNENIGKAKIEISSSQDMKNTLDWLNRKGIVLPAKTKVFVSPDRSSESESEFNSSTPTSPTKSPLKTGRKPINVDGIMFGMRMSNAMKFLEQKGYDVKKKAVDNRTSGPSLKDTAEAMKVLQKKDMNIAGKSKPSTDEMESTLNWLKLREKERDEEEARKEKKRRGKKKSKSSKKRENKKLSGEDMQKALKFLHQAGKTEGDEDTSIGLEKTVEWLKQESQKSFPKTSAKIKREKVPKLSEQPKELTGQETEHDKILFWLTNPTDDLEDAIYYKKLHNMLPGKASQSNEIRAREITKAMKWVKRQGLLGLDKEEESRDSVMLFEEDLDASKSQDVEVELNESLTENENGLMESPKGIKMRTVKDTMKSKKLLSQDVEVELNDSLTETENGLMESPNGIKRRTVKDTMKSKKLLSPKVKRKSSKKDTTMKDMLSPRKPRKGSKKNDYKNALAWLKERNDDSKDAKYFKKLDSMVPKTEGQTMEERASELVKALQWVRKTTDRRNAEEEGSGSRSASPSSRRSTTKSPRSATRRISRNSPKGVPKEEKKKAKSSKKADKEKIDNTVIGLKALMKSQQTKIAKDDKTKSKKVAPISSSAERDYDNALTFIKAKENGTSLAEIEDANNFKKLDKMLPKKADQGPEDRAKEMVKMLAWLRKKGKI